MIDLMLRILAFMEITNYECICFLASGVYLDHFVVASFRD